ncbi:hypothetical protein C8R43DRAFT_1161456 [Mycena crocata]|nr:hypothetical protein C8R43DRAFT_1161456 [Mycena crocata]
MSETPKFLSNEKEAFWFQRRVFLEKAGYRLRPKFNPGFVGPKPPSTYNLGDDHTAQHPRKHIMDAERISDNQQVMLKWISKKTHPFEVEIGRLFSAPAMAKNPRNHCIPILNVLQDPHDQDKQIIVMPRLIRFDEPIFDTVGEVIDCFRQIFEGIQFMHENLVAHRIQQSYILVAFIPSITALIQPTMAWRTTLHAQNAGLVTTIIDFGLSRRYDPSKGPPVEHAVSSGDRNPPEYGAECNPFPADIYCLGNLLKRHFIRSDPSCVCGGDRHPPLQFLKPLVDDMTHNNPAMRPTIGEVIVRFNHDCARLSQWQLRKPGQALEWHAWFNQALRQVKNIFKGIPALPSHNTTTSRTLSARMRAFYTKSPKAG